VPGNLGGPAKPVAVDGLIGPETINAISSFQFKNFGWRDGRVDVAGKTLNRLNDYAAAISDPTSPASAIMSGSGRPLGGADGSTIDGITNFARMGKILNVVGTLMSNYGPFHSNESAGIGVMLFTLNKSTAMVYMTDTGKSIKLPGHPASMRGVVP
jgi:hypothetical protein